MERETPRGREGGGLGERDHEKTALQREKALLKTREDSTVDSTIS